MKSTSDITSQASFSDTVDSLSSHIATLCIACDGFKMEFISVRFAVGLREAFFSLSPAAASWAPTSALDMAAFAWYTIDTKRRKCVG